MSMSKDRMRARLEKLESLRREFNRNEEEMQQLVAMFGHQFARIRAYLQVQDYEKQRVSRPNRHYA